MEAGHRPIVTESDGSEDFFQDGDTPVCTSFSAERGLDGVSRLEGCVLARSGSSGKPQVPQIRGVREGVPVQGSLLWAVHGSAGLPRVMVPVSAFLHRSGIRFHRYLNDWLIQAASREQVFLALNTVHLCHSLGIVVNWETSLLVPTQRIVYLGVLLDSISFRASPAQKRVEKLLSIGDVFLSCEEQPVSSWLELLGGLSSMIQLVPGGRLRMRSLQLVLRRAWDHCDQSVLVSWTREICLDLE